MSTRRYVLNYQKLHVSAIRSSSGFYLKELYEWLHKALLDKNLMMASNGRKMQFFDSLIHII